MSRKDIEVVGEIPRIDLGDLKNIDDFRQITEERRHEIGREVVKAFHRVGFLFVRAPRDYVDKLETMYDECENLFMLDYATKMHYASEKFNYQRGYTSVFTEEALYCKRVLLEGETERRVIKNYAENWFMGPEGYENARFAKPEHNKYSLANVWPVEVPGLRDPSIAVYEETREMSSSIMDTTEPFLGVSDGYFREVTKDSPTLLRQLHYPPAPRHLINYENVRSGKGEIVGACQHTDINYWTTLPKARNVLKNAGGGLRVKTRQGKEITGVAPEGYFIMQVGDMLQHETGGYFTSAQHRVISPELPNPMPPELRGRILLGRLSAAMFTHPRPDHMLSIKNLNIRGHIPKNYKDMYAHDELERRLNLIFGKKDEAKDAY